MAQGRAFQNAKWIIVCKIIQSLLQMLIGMITARYLGPANYGLINYAASLTSFALPFSQLGLSSTLVREYVSTPEREGAITGTAIVMNLVSSCMCMVCVIGFAAVFNTSEPITICVCALYSCSLLFQSLQITQHWFHAKLQAKYSSLATLAAYFLVSAYKIWLLVCNKNIYWFALVHTMEYSSTGLLMFIAYKKISGSSLRISWKLAVELFSRSKYYILASFMVTIFQNTDHVMLKMLVGDEANGYYTTAAACVGVANFVYMAIIDSVRPVILESHKRDRKEFERNVTALYSVVLYLALAQSIFFTLFARYIVLILYGEAYVTAVPILRVYAWIVGLSVIGSVRNIWILAEEKYSILGIINLSGAVTNVLLNAVMIPVWGPLGASAASVLTQFTTNVVIGYVIKPIRRNSRLLMNSLLPQRIWDFCKLLR